MIDTMTLQAPVAAHVENSTAAQEERSPNTFKAYVDGSALGNPGSAGWAVGLLERDAPGAPVRNSTIVGSVEHTTNNVMELTAVTMALTGLPLDARGTIWSDNKYVVKGLNEWLFQWRRSGWRTSNRKPVKNVLERLTLSALPQQRPSVSFKWARVHSGNRKNELANNLARAEVAEVRAGFPAVARLKSGR